MIGESGVLKGLFRINHNNRRIENNLWMLKKICRKIKGDLEG
jgi:hypothetical protein